MARWYLVTMVFTFLVGSCVGPSSDLKRIDIPHGVAVPSDSPLVASDPRVIEREIFEQINVFRSQKGLSPLQSDSILSEGARSHTAYMKRTAVAKGNPLLISHDHFLKRTRAMQRAGASSSIAENVGVVKGVSKYYVARTLVQGWIDSPGHYKNIVGDYVKTGVGVVVGDGNVIYSTQLFGGY